MMLSLSCYNCGSIDFIDTELDYMEVEGSKYLHHEDKLKSKVICVKCKMEDYVENLVIKQVEVGV